MFGNIAAAFKLHHFLNETIGNQSEKKLSVSSEEYNHTSNKLSIPLDGLKCDVLFDVMRSRLKSENDLFENMSAFIVQVNVLKDKTHAATWCMDHFTILNVSHLYSLFLFFFSFYSFKHTHSWWTF